MSHIFISYAHADKAHLDTLVDWLLERDFNDSELWYDTQLQTGNNWRDEIVMALDEAYALIIIVTKKSVESVYCTYEWAYAMGQGLEVFPLIFDDVKASDFPAPLASKHYQRCTDAIPESLRDQLLQLQSKPPQVEELNNTIHEIVFDTHRRFFLLGWVGADGISQLHMNDQEMLFRFFQEEATQARQELQNLLVDKSSAFNVKQHRNCWKLIECLKEIQYINYLYPHDFYEKLIPKFRSIWLPAFEYIEGFRVWRILIASAFSDAEANKMKIFAEIARAFPMILPDDVKKLLQFKIIDQQHRSS